MDEDRLPKIVTRNRPDGRRSRGRPKKKMVTKLKDGRILPWKNSRLLSLDIRRRRKRRRTRKKVNIFLKRT